MPDYSKGKIYTIRYRGDDSLVYVGSTTQSLSVRMAEHRRKYNVENRQEYNMLLYIKMRETNINDWYIELYEEFPCQNKNQLNKREGEIQRQISTLNKKIEGRTRQEWCIEHADKIKEHIKQYRNNNADKIKEQMKQYRENNTQKLKEYKKKYYEQNADKIKEHIKQYRNNNADKIKEHKKKWYQDNIDKIKEKDAQKCACECGSIVTHGNKSRHLNSKKHQDYLKISANIEEDIADEHNRRED